MLQRGALRSTHLGRDRLYTDGVLLWISWATAALDLGG